MKYNFLSWEKYNSINYAFITLCPSLALHTVCILRKYTLNTNVSPYEAVDVSSTVVKKSTQANYIYKKGKIIRINHCKVHVRIYCKHGELFTFIQIN